MDAHQQLGSAYTLDRLLGEGASGQVWLGHDRSDRQLAFKLLRSELASDQGIVHRFIQERQVLASIRHPHVVEVHDLVVEGSTLAIVMDYVDGLDLRSALRRNGPMTPANAARCTRHIALALEAAHARGVIHRDVKPENVLLEAGTGRARLTDFGIAKIVDGTHGSTMLLGTPQYMAPEIAEGREPTTAVDVYSLGILLYELCCGVTPYAGRGSAMAMLRGHALEMPGRPDGMPDPLWDLVTWMVQKDPRTRPAAAIVAEALDSQATQLADLPAAPRLLTPPPAVPTPVGTEAFSRGDTVLSPSPTAQLPQPASPPWETQATVLSPVAGSSPYAAPHAGTPLPGGLGSGSLGYAHIQPPGAPGLGGPPIAPAVYATPAPPPDHRRARTALVIALVLALVGIAGVGAALVLRRGDGASTQDAAATKAASPTPTTATATATPTPTTVPTVTVTATPPPTVTVTQTPTNAGASSAPTQMESRSVVEGFYDLVGSGSLRSSDMPSHFTPTVIWYGSTQTREELYSSLSKLDLVKYHQTYERGVFTSFVGGTTYAGLPASRIVYYVAYHKSTGNGAVLVNYTVVKTPEGSSLMAAVSESPA